MKFAFMRIALLSALLWGPVTVNGQDQCMAGDNTCEDAQTAMQVKSSIVNLVKRRSKSHKGRQPGCTPLQNMGTHSTVKTLVGSPPQSFDIVADTGSNALIVPSCFCKQHHDCDGAKGCFHQDSSSTFTLSTADKGGPVGVLMSYGSGDIEAVVASDTVSVGGVEAVMKNTLLLMTTDKDLELSGEFSGILGLGPPMSPENALIAENVEERSFLEEAGMGGFSICFNDQAPGVLRIDGSSPEGAMGNIGELHWGLAFEGLSVGGDPTVAAGEEGAAKPVIGVCDKMTHPDQETPCGAIPDSGTTLMMGPQSHINKLYTSICDNWERCSAMFKELKKSKDMQFVTKSLLAEELVADCDTWMGDSDAGLNELPPLHFKLAGKDGGKTTISLSPSSYVLQTSIDDLNSMRERLSFFKELSSEERSKVKMHRDDRATVVCTLGFSELDYPTTKNGDVWLFGTPVFFEYTVAYNMGLEDGKATIAILDQPCGSCDSSLIGEDSSDKAAKSNRSQTASKKALPRRKVLGAPRIPKINTALPL
eukprot:gnl/TRDRNA2_/TRDRNA2_178559_c0_seq1.p1 gnl/TRDRNA2_/TRDRNA2_178559_c0~~gnl/TRDRNA2_/TRDRNA2_178559_c0_seq1.p1  ORF type:complete len:536 (+),score=112.31 gnl/TRDRNA2_/TRDRNA2_178559_c0_seq1:81-1688(+)